MDDEVPPTRPWSPKAAVPRELTEAELSRIARQAVHQAPDPGLDRQLARMGLTDPAPSGGGLTAEPASRPAAVEPELAHLRNELRRLKAVGWGLAGIIAILVVLVIVLLAR
ncbi:MAG: hypothetical protein ABI553_11145 [Chloroflexota bacterium]